MAMPVMPTAAADQVVCSLLRTCKTLTTLHQLHAHILKTGLSQHHLLATRFLSTCASLSAVRYASEFFDHIEHPNPFHWNALLSSFSDRRSLSATLSLFNAMRSVSSVRPDNFSFPPVLKACAGERDWRVGAMVHCCGLRVGVVGDLFVATALVDVYGKCKDLESARKVFDGMRHRNEVSWTAMVVGYLSSGCLSLAREMFDGMPERNVVAWNAMIGGYVKEGDLESARKLFDDMLERNVASFTSLIDGYAKAGDILSARALFDRLHDKDLFSWSAMISGYVQNGRPDEALKIFFEMQRNNVRPDEFIVVGLVSACSELGDLALAKSVDSYVTQSQINLRSAHVVSALVDMNAKCGNMERAAILFETLQERDLITYCSMMQGYSIHGCGDKALQLFSRMLNDRLVPDRAVFTVLLTACSHAGLVDAGHMFLKLMKDEYHIAPSSHHYAIVVDLLGRGGQLKEANNIIESMPVEPHAGAWGALLGACRLHGNVELAETVAKRLFKLEPHGGGGYVLLSNIYAEANRWSDVSDVRALMKERDVKKMLGCSWV